MGQVFLRHCDIVFWVDSCGARVDAHSLATQTATLLSDIRQAIEKEWGIRWRLRFAWHPEKSRVTPTIRFSEDYSGPVFSDARLLQPCPDWESELVTLLATIPVTGEGEGLHESAWSYGASRHIVFASVPLACPPSLGHLSLLTELARAKVRPLVVGEEETPLCTLPGATQFCVTPTNCDITALRRDIALEMLGDARQHLTPAGSLLGVWLPNDWMIADSLKAIGLR